MQIDLEHSLEVLDEKNEEDWRLYLEKDHNGIPQITTSFMKYKEESGTQILAHTNPEDRHLGGDEILK